MGTGERGRAAQRTRNGHRQTAFEKYPALEQVFGRRSALPMLKGQQLGSRVNSERSDLLGRRIRAGHGGPESAIITFLAVPDIKDASCE